MQAELHDQATLEEAQNDWSLTADQMFFMLSYHNAIENAYQWDDMDFLRQLHQSEEYMAAFGIMSWDEAYDRYETMIDGDS